MMVNVMYNDKLVYKLIMWVFFVISLWKEKEALSKLIRINPFNWSMMSSKNEHVLWYREVEIRLIWSIFFAMINIYIELNLHTIF